MTQSTAQQLGGPIDLDALTNVEQVMPEPPAHGRKSVLFNAYVKGRHVITALLALVAELQAKLRTTDADLEGTTRELQRAKEELGTVRRENRELHRLLSQVTAERNSRIELSESQRAEIERLLRAYLALPSIVTTFSQIGKAVATARLFERNGEFVLDTLFESGEGGTYSVDRQGYHKFEVTFPDGTTSGNTLGMNPHGLGKYRKSVAALPWGNTNEKGNDAAKGPRHGHVVVFLGLGTPFSDDDPWPGFGYPLFG